MDKAVEKAVELFKGRIIPEWYMKLESNYKENWGATSPSRKKTDARQYWTELSLSLLMQPKPDKGMLRTAIEATKVSNKDLHDKLKEKLRILR